MKICLVSDLHLEFQDINIQNTENADVLILSGDICIANDMHDHPAPLENIPSHVHIDLGSRQRCAYRFRDFFKRVSFQFPHVVVVAGNHEFYHGKWVSSLTHLRHEYGQFPNIHFLERDTVVIDDVRFLGGTLWTDMNKGDPLTMHAISGMMQDYSVIRNDDAGYTKLRPAHTMSRHRQTVQYIKHILGENKDQKCVVVGHHGPSSHSIPDYYKAQTLMNGAYVSDLSELILDHPNIALWTAGHTHTPYQYRIGETLVACNPRGYAGFERCADTFVPLFLDI
jgi:predicted phosphodiesterase